MENQTKAIWDDLHLELEKFIFARVKDTDAGRDILQDVFLKIHLNLHTLNDSGKLTSWVYQITRNAITDHFRKQKKDKHNTIPDLHEEESQEPLYAGLSNCISQKIALLPEQYRQAVLLTAFREYSQAEAAQQLNISYTAAKSRVQRAKEQLRGLMLHCRNITADSLGKITGHNFDEKK